MYKRLLLLSVAALVTSTPIAAQSRSAVSSTELDAAVTSRQTDARQKVEQFIGANETKQAAQLLGISESALSARVAQLDSATLERIAQQITASEEPLAGGVNILGISIGIVALIIILWLIFD